jgi:demethylmenaquinone methyltransferase / 2-methoxy-6-polyprenyl-1,4-benzoquinol methylase
MPERAVPGNRVPATEVRSMFDRIARIYDPMNTLMTAGRDRRWRRAATRATALATGMRALDVACGTGALTRELALAVGPRGSVTGVDVSRAMLRRAGRHGVPVASATPHFLVGDALALPIDDASVDAVTIAFGLRNVADVAQALSEMARVVRPGGRVVVLEISTPASGPARALAATWFERVVPLVGRVAGEGSAYAYLPTSVRRYPAPETVVDLLEAAGLADVRWRRLATGLVTLHVARRPRRD